jgi:hypothetical protein
MRGFLAVSLVVVSLVLDGCGGCGDDGKGKQLPDAPMPIDMMPDMPPDMMALTVALTITNLGSPVPNVTVYFVNADDSVAKSAVTDATGTASTVMAAGGSVTAIDPFAAVNPVAPSPAGGITGPELRTFLGVKPGDHLFLTRAIDQVSIPLNVPAVEGANRYSLFSTCGSQFSIIPGGGSGSGTSVILENCHGGADIAILAISHNGESPDEGIAGLYHADATVMDGHEIDLSGDEYQALTNLTFTFTNTPDATLDVQHAPIAKHGAIGPFPVDMSGPSGAIQEPTLTGVTKAVVDMVLVTNTRHEVVDWGAYTANYTLDLGSVLLSEFTAGPSFDLATSKLSWTEDGAGATADLSMVSAVFQRTEPNFKQWHWALAAPHPAATEIKLPKLPTDLFDWNPTTGDSVTPGPVTNAKLPGGYDAVRAHIFDIVERGRFSDYVAGASGRAVIAVSALP